MGRALKKHLQQCFAIYSKPLDKNGQLRGARKGEKRVGVGRPKRGQRASERHKRRPSFSSAHPIHVTLRADEATYPLRRKGIYRAVRRATRVVARRIDMRIIELSIQNTHLHLLVEAADRVALAKGMQAFGVSAARAINAVLSEQRAVARHGAVIADRYHARVLKTPREVRNCLSYVLNNWRHQLDRTVGWQVDPYSSGHAFGGWRELAGKRLVMPVEYKPLVVSAPRTWLLRVGWKQRGLISFYEVPGGDTD